MFLLLSLLACNPHTLPADTGTSGAGGADTSSYVDDTGTDDSATDDSATDTAADDTATDDSATSDDTAVDTGTPPDDTAVEDTDSGTATYTDVDGDGWSVEGGDCNDLASAVNPAATEIPGNAVDEDCNGVVEPAATDTGTADTGTADTGTADTGTADTGTAYTDGDADGWSVEGGDCNDEDATVNPAAIETANDGVDNDCDGVAVVTETDADSDGYGVSVDCDDTDAATNPGALDGCDGIDQNCDGQDGDASGITDWYLDADSDGYGDSAEYVDAACPGGGYTSNEVFDCDDTDSSVSPHGTEICGDGIDQDCSGADQACPASDDDSDGYAADVDCDDADATVYPGAAETVDDGIDQDCDGSDETLATLQDEALCGGTDQMACFVDVDGDGKYETLLMDAGQWTLPELYDADAEIYENGYGSGCGINGDTVESNSMGFYVITFSGSSCTTQLTLTASGSWWQNYIPATDGSDTQGVFVNTGGYNYLVGIDWRSSSGLQF